MYTIRHEILNIATKMDAEYHEFSSQPINPS